MKKLIIFAALVFGIYSCSKLDELTHFKVNLEQQVTIPATTVVSVPLDITTPAIETNYELAYSNNNTSIDLIESVKLNSMSMTVKSPSGSNFDYLSSLRLYLVADGLDRVMFASATDIPDGLSELDMTIEDIDFKPYFESGSFRIQIKAETDKVISQSQEIDLLMQIGIDAKILGV